MKLVEVIEEVYSTFLDTWQNDDATKDVLLVREGVRDDAPQDAQPWARIAIRHATGEQASVGGLESLHRRDGTVHVQCFGRDVREANEMAEVATRAFEGKGDALWFYDVGPGNGEADTHWFRINVTAGFAYHVTRKAS